MNSMYVYCILNFWKKLKDENFIQVFMTSKKHLQSVSYTPQNYQWKKKKKKSRKKNKINIGTSIIYCLRCTIKVLRYFIYENKIWKFHIWNFCGGCYKDSMSIFTTAPVKNRCEKKRKKILKKTKINKLNIGLDDSIVHIRIST